MEKKTKQMNLESRSNIKQFTQVDQMKLMDIIISFNKNVDIFLLSMPKHTTIWQKNKGVKTHR